jgi:hypothetical protein
MLHACRERLAISPSAWISNSEALVEKLFSGTTPEQQRDTALHRYPQGGAISIDEAPPAEAPKAVRIRVVPPAIAGQIQQ